MTFTHALSLWIVTSRRRWRAIASWKIITGLLLLGGFVGVAVIGPALAAYNPSNTSSIILAAPSFRHLLGTTSSGQDLLSELLYGTRQSILVGFVAAGIGETLAIAFGVAAGYLGGIGDEGLSAVINVFLVLPVLPLEVVLASYLSHDGWFGITLIIAITAWPFGARQLRAQTIALRSRDFVSAGQLAGDGPLRMITFEIAPNLLAIIASGFLFQVIFAVIVQTSLSFLGITSNAVWSWGTILYWAQTNNALLSGAWWWFVPPGLCLGLLGLSLALVNLGIDEVMNPRLVSTSRLEKLQKRATHGTVVLPPATAGNPMGAADI